MPLPAENRLSRETSPYLLQHRENPVHWRAWSAEALGEARERDRPILLSVGYAACHWCHVMAHESFEDAEVAAVMNRLFVNIKVDREERPDIDQIFMAALTATGEQGGWPLTMFLTPDGKPFWGGTYFPKEPRFGRPGFVQVLEAVHKAWTDKRGELAASADTLTTHVERRLAPDAAATSLSPGRLKQLADAISGMIDGEAGGLRGAPKFPNAPFMEVLWLNWLQHGKIAHRDAVVDSLRHMLSGGIYDHVGGGLARYSTDADWIVPHFEKMLYDNAQLLRSASWAFAATGDGLFRRRIEETADWFLREMRVTGGGFASSFDADSEGEEGRFYLWTREQIEAVLGGDTNALLAVYELSVPPGWEADPILNRRRTPDAASPETEDRLRALLDRLRTERARRVPPARDDKVLVDWNGLAIAALAQVGRQFDRRDWIEAAEGAFRFVCESMENGRLPHSIGGGRALFPALASDYAAMIDAAIALFEATGNAGYVVRARDLFTALDEWHADGAGAGFFLTASDTADVPMRIRGDVDEAVPSATALVIRAMTRLSGATGDHPLYERTVRVAEAALGRAVSQQYGQAGIVCAAALAMQPMKLVIADPKGSAGFVPATNRQPDPRRVDIAVSGSEAEGLLPPGTRPDTSTPGAWLCVGMACLPPIRDGAALEQTLREHHPVS